MADGTQVDSLFLAIESNSQSASDGIDTLVKTLEKLKGSIKDGLRLSSVGKELDSIGKKANSAAPAKRITDTILTKTLTVSTKQP